MIIGPRISRLLTSEHELVGDTPMLIVLFGLSGAGKSYVGRLLNHVAKVYYWEADDALTEEFKQCIFERKPLTQVIRDDYFSVVMPQINQLLKQHQHVVVSQAFYKNKNRQALLKDFPETIFIKIEVDLPILVQRLQRRNSEVDEQFALQMSKEFEEPEHTFYRVDNNAEKDEKALLEQLQKVPEIKANLCFSTSRTDSSRLFFFGEEITNEATSQARNLQAKPQK